MNAADRPELIELKGRNFYLRNVSNFYERAFEFKIKVLLLTGIYKPPV